MAFGDRGFAGYLHASRFGYAPPVPGLTIPASEGRARASPTTSICTGRRATWPPRVRALHGRGYVVGDVNESNILVGHSALITLVDTDSFQVCGSRPRQHVPVPRGQARVHPAGAKGKRFTSIDRTPEHDRFGLAVLIFQLLMEGTHPFAGLYRSGEDPPPYEARIACGQFPYGNRRGPYRPIPDRSTLRNARPEPAQALPSLLRGRPFSPGGAPRCAHLAERPRQGGARPG